MKQEFMVYVSCKTYNQSQYIKDALDGFCMQQTDFPFVCAIFDDASTDGEPEVIRQYLLEHFNLNDDNVMRVEETDDYIRIFAQHKKNSNCYFVVVLLKYNHYRIRKNKEQYIHEWIDNVRYIAYCEGDDYWIDSHKLQKQFDYLEVHPSVGMCYTQCRYYYQNKGIFAKKSWGGNAESFEEMIQSNPVPTASTMCRQGLNERYMNEINPQNRSWMLGDYPLWLWIAKEYGVKFINEVTCVYRVLDRSASHRDDRRKREDFIISVCNIQRFFADKYHQSELIDKDKAEKALLMDAFSNKDYEAVAHHYRTIEHPGMKNTVKYLFATMFLKICRKK